MSPPGNRPQLVREIEPKDVAASLAMHEAVCAERWQTMRKSFEALDAKVDKFFWAMLACAVSVIGTLVVQLMKAKGIG